MHKGRLISSFFILISLKSIQVMRMETNKYKELAMSTLNKELSKKDILINSVMGLCGESGEVIDIVKKHLSQGHELDVSKIKEELGDVCWYIAEACYALDLDFNEVLEDNINKLKKRYPNGFSSERSIHRE